MSVRTVLTFVDGSQGDETRLARAFKAARSYDAHATIVTFGILPEIVPEPYAGVAPLTLDAEFRNRAITGAEDLAKQVSEQAEAEGIRYDVRARVSTPSSLAEAFGARARFADLVLLDHIASESGDIMRRAAFEGALFQGDAAVLLCPQETGFAFEKVMIAWDGGNEALRAVRRGFPLMSAATEVEIVTVDASEWQAASAEDLAQMLSRHDLSVSIFNASSRDNSEVQTLAQRQIETGADLTILGGYAHSRFREAVFGGVTEDLPAVSHTPLLMAH